MHTRWLAFAVCAVAVAAIGYGIFAPWLDLPAKTQLGLQIGAIERVPGWAWVFQVITVAGIAFALVRKGSPRPAGLVLAATGVIGAASMLLTVRLLDRSVAADVFGNRIDVVIAPGAWIVVAGFAATVVGGLLVLRASREPAD
jgi:hypothetical protein